MGLFGIATNSVQMLVLVAVLTVAVFAVLYFEKFGFTAKTAKSHGLIYCLY